MSIYEVVSIAIAGVLGALGLAKYILMRQDEEGIRMQDDLKEHAAEVNNKLDNYVRREEFEREMDRFHQSLTSVRDEVIGSSRAHSLAINNLTTRIDGWMLAQNNKQHMRMDD